MKNLVALTLLTLASVEAHAGIEVVYGQDNRQDLYQVSNSLYKKLASSTAAMMPVQQFGKTAKQGVFDFLGTKTLERGENVCSQEKFSQQPLGAMCSGFLVGNDTIVTAGHCYKSFATPEQVCKQFAWVFGFDMKSSSSDPTKSIPVNNIYLCKKVAFAELSQDQDFSIIKLDRPVVGREPLKFRTSGKISDSAKLVVIGHPSGLPTKVSPGGKITRNVESTRFSTNLDTFHGNSGSAVFDASTGMVEGILIQGKNDYVPSKKNDPKSCVVVNVCDENGNNCAGGQEQGGVQWGEVVLRITNITSKISSAVSMKLK